MNFEIVPAHELALNQQAKIFNAAFAGYVGGTFELDAGALSSFMSLQGIDLCYSRFARANNGQIVSFGYINRTGSFSRLAGMGTIASARRSGAAAFVLSQLLIEAKQRSDEAMILEVIQQNPAAVALYESHGFRSIDHLLGWRGAGRRTAVGDRPAHSIREIPVAEALGFPGTIDYPTLPWQISRHAAAKVARAHAYAVADVAVVVGDTDTSPIRLHGFPGFDGSNWPLVRDLTSDLVARFPGREFYAPPIFPETFGREVFQPLGFQQDKISQFLMRKDL